MITYRLAKIESREQTCWNFELLVLNVNDKFLNEIWNKQMQTNYIAVTDFKLVAKFQLCLDILIYPRKNPGNLTIIINWPSRQIYLFANPFQKTIQNLHPWDVYSKVIIGVLGLIGGIRRIHLLSDDFVLFRLL